MTTITIFRNVVDKQTYRLINGELQYRCMATHEWFPSKRDIWDVRNQSVSYDIEVPDSNCGFDMEYVKHCTERTRKATEKVLTESTVTFWRRVLSWLGVRNV